MAPILLQSIVSMSQLKFYAPFSNGGMKALYYNKTRLNNLLILVKPGISIVSDSLTKQKIILTYRRCGCYTDCKITAVEPLVKPLTNFGYRTY